MDFIKVEDEFKLRAVTDFLRQSVDRTQWGTRGLVNESSFDEFADNLQRTWNSHKTKTNILLAGKSNIERGQYLYAECSSQQLKLQDLEVPPHFTPGSFHALADDKAIGWHPQYIEQLTASPVEDNT